MNHVKSILKVSGQGVSRSYLYCVVMTVCLRPSPVSPKSACFGIIVKCDGVGFFDYKLAQVDERAIERIAGFFPRYGRDNVVRAMEWAAHDVDFAIEGEKEDRAVFQDLIRPRAIVRRLLSRRTIPSLNWSVNTRIWYPCRASRMRQQLQTVN